MPEDLKKREFVPEEWTDASIDRWRGLCITLGVVGSLLAAVGVAIGMAAIALICAVLVILAAVIAYALPAGAPGRVVSRSRTGVLLAIVTACLPITAAQASSAHNGAAHVHVPRAARAVDTSHPTRWIGNGTAASCTSAAVVAAVRAGGVIRFRCGPQPITITLRHTAKVVNSHGPRVVLDGRNLVTLSGAGKRRILYMDTCDQKQVWTTSHCDDQNTPRLVVQNLRLVDGNSIGQDFDGGGGGAIFARGGRLKLVHDTFVHNRCEKHGPDIGGAAVRALSQYHGRPVYVVDSTFRRNVCSNGAGLSSIGVSWVVLNSRFEHNRAIGHGANPAHQGTPGGGSGGAIYTDGNTYTVSVAGTTIADNHANEGGGAIFYVSNDRTGSLAIDHSTLQRNPSDGFQTQPGIYYLGKGTKPKITHSIVK